VKVVRGYKTELDLNNEQRTACLKHAGCARFAYNWGLARSQEVYCTTGKRPSAAALHKELVTLKQSDYPWMYEVSKCAIQEALRDLDTAFKHFFRKVALKKQGKFKGKVGFPKFKKKGKAIGSFRFPEGKKIHVHADAIQLPRLGCLRLKERGYLPPTAKVLSATVSEKAGRWFISVQEDLHVTGMLKNHKLAQAVSDSNFGEIRRQLEYKAPWQGSHVVVIDRFYPSSKTCSGCGSLKPELSLRERVYECSACGLTIDRDLNAAINLRTVAVGFTDTRNACGERSSDLLNGGSETALVEAGTKQENGA